MVVGIEQHLMRLSEIRPKVESPAVTQLEVRNLQLGADAIDPDPIFTPIELECFARCKPERHIHVFTG